MQVWGDIEARNRSQKVPASSEERIFPSGEKSQSDFLVSANRNSAVAKVLIEMLCMGTFTASPRLTSPPDDTVCEG